jgi:PTH1 family peptidyl-tRNA hydrolase
MKAELAVIGLGNPGPEYEGTRHNVGFEVLRRVASRHGRRTAVRQHGAIVIAGNISGTRVSLVQPTTYMNRSGESVRAIAEAEGLSSDRVWVVTDDFQIPIGTLRIRQTGSDGGHNGLASVIQALDTVGFPRFRLGVGSPPERASTVDYVLGQFTNEERAIVDDLVEHAAAAIEAAVRDGLPRAMSRFNGSILKPEA